MSLSLTPFQLDDLDPWFLPPILLEELPYGLIGDEL